MPSQKGRWTGFFLWIGLTIVTLLPIYWMVLVSLRRRVDLFGNPSLIPDRIFWGNYAEVLADDRFQRFMVNSLIVATSNAVLVCALGLLAAYAMSRYKLSGKNNLFFWTLTNRMAPPAAFLIAYFLLFTIVFRVGDATLLDTRIGLIFVYCVFNLPFALWLLQGIIDGIPKELDEAAMVDGASVWQVLWTIILPLAKPGLAVTAILTWVFAWNEYLLAATLTRSDARTVTTYLAEFVTVTGTNWGAMAAAATLTLLPAVIFLGLVQRHIVAGLTFGAVKE